MSAAKIVVQNNKATILGLFAKENIFAVMIFIVERLLVKKSVSEMWRLEQTGLRCCVAEFVFPQRFSFWLGGYTNKYKILFVIMLVVQPL